MALEIKEPEDIISSFVYNLFKKQDEKRLFDLAAGWNKKIGLNVKSFYPVTIIFDENKIKFECGSDDGVDLNVSLDLKTVLDTAYNRLNPIMGVLTGRIKVKGLFKLETVLRFYKIFFTSLKNVAAEPNENYFEVDKLTR